MFERVSVIYSRLRTLQILPLGFILQTQQILKVTLLEESGYSNTFSMASFCRRPHIKKWLYKNGSIIKYMDVWPRFSYFTTNVDNTKLQNVYFRLVPYCK